MKDLIIQAIDIGTTKVAAIVAKKLKNGKIEILGIGNAPSYGVKRAEVNNIDYTVSAIKQAVKEAELQSGFTFKKVFVGIAGNHIKSMQHRGILMRSDYNSIITQKDLKRLEDDLQKLALPPGDKIIHVIPQEFIVDSTSGIQKPIGMPGSRLEGNYHVVTGSTTAINNITRCIQLAGLEVVDIILQPLASAAAVLDQKELEAGVALVDIGGGTTDVAIFVDKIIRHAAVIPFGGEIITEDIRTGCRILKDQAETLKIKFGTAWAQDNQDNEIVSIPGLRERAPREISLKNLSYIIQARMEEIMDRVQHELRISGFESGLIGGIVLTGGGSQLKHILQLTEYITGLEARRGVPDEYLSPSKVTGVDNPSYATGIGLIIKALEKYDNEQDTVIEAPVAVENPVIVENEKSSKIEKTVALEAEIEREKPVNPKSLKGMVSTFTSKIAGWISEDIEDFETNVNNNKNK